MKKKFLLALLSLFFCVMFTTSVSAQDVIIKKNGKKVKALIKEVTDTQIKYHDYNDPGGILFTMDRALIREIKFAHGKKMKEEGPSQDESYYFDDNRNNVKLNFTAIGRGYTILTYERAIDTRSAWEASLKFPGLGVKRNDEELSGFGVNVGYKMKLGSLFKKRGDYRPKHLLHGWYFRPNIGYTYSKTENEDVFLFGSNDGATVKRGFANFGLDFGIQWILNNRLSIDLYAGFHYYAGGINEIKLRGTGQPVDSVDYNLYVDARGGDLIGENNTAATFGLRVGFLFDTKDKKKKKR